MGVHPTRRHGDRKALSGRRPPRPFFATPVKAAPCFDRDTSETAAQPQPRGEPEGGLPSATIAKVAGQIYADERGGSAWVTSVLAHECHLLGGSRRLEFDSDGECGVLVGDTTGQVCVSDPCEGGVCDLMNCVEFGLRLWWCFMCVWGVLSFLSSWKHEGGACPSASGPTRA